MKDLPDICDRVVKWGLAALIVFTPLAFGTVEVWSIALLEWGITSLFLVFALGFLWPSSPRSERSQSPTGLVVPLALFLLLCVLQTVPIPYRWLGLISPGSTRMYADPGFNEVARARHPLRDPETESDPLLHLTPSAWRTISVSPGETTARVRLLALFVAVSFMVSRWADRSSRIVFLSIAVTMIGSVVGFLGLVQFLTWNGKIYWFREIPRASSFGPFVNHNHFAGYVGMVIPVAISLVFYLIEARRRPQFDSKGRNGVPEHARWGQAGLALFASAILVVTLILSRSRGGLLATLASGSILFIALWPRIQRRLMKWSVLLALPALVVGLTIWIGADTFQNQVSGFQRLEGEASFRLRAKVWKRVVRHLPDFIWTGSGLGSFEDSFAPFTPPGASHRWDKAHNDYLQILWETGIIGFTLFLVGIYIFFRRYWLPALRSRGHPLDIFRVGIAVSLFSIALHSVVDFNLQIGANGFLCALLAGLLVALKRVNEHDHAQGPILVKAGELPV